MRFQHVRVLPPSHNASEPAPLQSENFKPCATTYKYNVYGNKRGRYDWSAACSHAFRPSSVFSEDKEGGSGGGSPMVAYIYAIPFCSPWGPLGRLLASLKLFLEAPRRFFGGFIFWWFFASIFVGFLVPTWVQLGFQNPPKSMKNRGQDAFAC